jgi:hypothetical protein
MNTPSEVLEFLERGRQTGIVKPINIIFNSMTASKMVTQVLKYVLCFRYWLLNLPANFHIRHLLKAIIFPVSKHVSRVGPITPVNITDSQMGSKLPATISLHSLLSRNFGNLIGTSINFVAYI